MEIDGDGRHPLHRSGVAHFRRGEIAQAIESIERALAQGADPAVCHRDLCETRRGQGRPDAALGHGCRAAELAPALQATESLSRRAEFFAA